MPLESTTLAWASYLPDQNLLQLGFHTGAIYDYFDVPSEICRALLAYFNQQIRNIFQTQVHHRSANSEN